MSGFSGDWDGRRPPVHRPPDPPLSLEGLETAARILQDQLGPDWMVRTTAYPKLRLIAHEWPMRPGGRWIVAKTLEEARQRIKDEEEE